MFKPHADFEVLQRLFPAIRELQQLADKHGIDDIFQDNGGKILQLCLCLGIDVLPGGRATMPWMPLRRVSSNLRP